MTKKRVFYDFIKVDFSNMGDIRIGSYYNSWYFDGLVDEFSVYTNALTTTEVEELYGITE